MKKILLIEDNDQMIKLYSGLLGDEGYAVLVATNGKQGITMAHKNKPDVILLDIMLPGGINGFDVLERLKRDKDLKDVPVLVLTNLDSEEEVAKEIGAENYLVKAHSDPKDVVRLIKKSVEKYAT